MNKTKKLIIICIIFIINMLIAKNVNAAETRYFGYWDLCYNEKLLCTQHHQAVNDSVAYRLINTIEISGNKSTGNGKTVESWHNVKLASILSNRRGIGAYGDGDVEYLPVQNAIWNYFHTWIDQVGTQHGISKSFTNNARGNFHTKIEDKATEDANNYKETNTTLSDKTDKTKIT